MRDRVVLFFSYLFPVIFFFAFGEGFDAAKSAGNAAQVVSMVLVLGVLGNGFFGGGIRAVLERETGILRRFKVAPISAGPILVSSIVTGWVIYMPAVVAFFLLAHWRYRMPAPENPVSIAILLSLGIIAFRAMGLIIASVVNTMGESQVLVQLLYFPMLLLSGATIPLSTMPDWLQVVAQFLPATHLYLGLQGMLLDGEGLTKNLAAAGALAAAAAVALFISLKLFRWEKEDRLKTSAKLWVAAALGPFLLLGAWQAVTMENLEKTRILERRQNRAMTWLIRGPRIVTGEGRVIESGSVLVRRGVIVSVTEGLAADGDGQNAEILDAAGRTLLPGLIDQAVVLPEGNQQRTEEALRSHLYAGVTGVVAVGPRAPVAAVAVMGRLESGALLASSVLAVNLETPAARPMVLSEWMRDVGSGRSPGLLAGSLAQQVLALNPGPAGIGQGGQDAGAATPYSMAGRAGLPHGPSLHRQLQLMVKSGLSPADALMQVTGGAARALGKPVGRIAPGLDATMVLVDGNPLEDIAATEHIVAVFLKGERVYRTGLLSKE
ncbi:MAG: hypothetical protein C0504_12815 [Candidatus Solibacter sp.]|nr:hypothetical protein [Candidatus Solibacter sp.]